MAVKLRDYQLEAINNLHTGSILCGDVGSGKSITSIAYYYNQEGGDIAKGYKILKKKLRDLYIITTARKRDTLEWDGELSHFLLSRNTDEPYDNKVVVDSWNNIKKYVDIKGAFFIFDEQRVVGSGTWVKSFLKIVKNNDWILLSATPGDTWSDYIPVFIANGFYKNRTEFNNEHVIYKRFSKFPQIDRYIGTRKLERLRSRILVMMKDVRKTTQHHIILKSDYDTTLYKSIFKTRWNVETGEPIKNAAELCMLLRKVVNTDISKQILLTELCNRHHRIIVFYNFDYELDILKNIDYGADVAIAEWNGHKHQPIPDSDKWIYLVQYTAGAEGWNCTLTDVIVFFSPNYSYKIMHQAAGRIDRMNTTFRDLYYYHFASKSSIDMAIGRALSLKKKFNETKTFGKYFAENTKSIMKTINYF